MLSILITLDYESSINTFKIVLFLHQEKLGCDEPPQSQQ